MKIKPIYIFNIFLIIIVLAMLFTPLHSYLEKLQGKLPNSEISSTKETVLTSEQYNIDLKGINTHDTNFQSFKEKKIFLNFWASWCEPCREEMPSIQKLYNRKKNEAQFVLIYMKDNQKEVMKFLQENHYDFPVYEAASPIDPELLPIVFPTTFIINEKGKILKKTEKAEDWSNFKF
ncbi:MAG: TlpA family protein disulfide reductase [Flavobacteriaceae bacterium]|jgi:thiol-disulfide isomerase/thioredoxin|nr:TlpA family protein disulfide reductase [Flavobacteriaceae bacterium]